MAISQKVAGSNQVVEFERWTAKRKAEAVLEVIKGKVTLVDFCRASDLKQSEVERWMEEFIRSGTRGLTQGSKDKQDHKEQEIDQLKKTVGEQTLQILALKKKHRDYRTGRKRVLRTKVDLESLGHWVSIRKICERLDLPRNSVYRDPTRRRAHLVDEVLASEIHQMIDLSPYQGVRRITWRIRKNRPERAVNWKKVHRILKLKGWVVLGWRSRTDQPNKQWAIDTSHFFTRRDGWCHIPAVIDCCDRSIVRWIISRSGKAQIAAAALEDALIRRTPGPGLKLRSDNGLLFGAVAFFKTVRGANISQEFITPYTPEQNGMIERWFRTLKEKCLWLNNFKALEEARTTIEEFILRYTTTDLTERWECSRRRSIRRNMRLSGLQTGEPYRCVCQPTKSRSLSKKAWQSLREMEPTPLRVGVKASW